MRRRGRHGGWSMALAVFAACAALQAAGALRPLDDALADLRARWSMREVATDIVIVGIDGASHEALGQPISRRHLARLLDQLARAAPRSVFLDVDLGSLAAPEDDLALETRLAMPRDFPVVLPAFLTAGEGPSPELRKPRARFARRTAHAVVPEPPARGLTRAWRTSWDVRGVREPSIIDPDRRLPDGDEVSIDYSISPASFLQVSFIDVVEGQVSHEVFAGKRVFVGPTGDDAGARISVPLHGLLPRVVVQALATETVNLGARRVLSGWWPLAFLAIWTTLVAAALAARDVVRRRRNLARVTVGLAIALAILGAAALFLLDARGLRLEVAAPLLVLVLLFMARDGSALRGRLRRALGYVRGFGRRDAVLRSIVQSSTDCIVCMDEAGIIQTANPAASRLFDCPGHELMDQPLSKFVALLAGDDAGARLDELHGVIRECDARTARGEIFPVEISVSRVRLTTAWLYTAVVRDIRDRRAQRRRLQHLATHDELTGLHNRAALMALRSPRPHGNSRLA